ncbi:hypothetical protein [Pacificimonas flava]|uniref:hypothetical protein n=1 Tax=Pacificimonas flava TaxID=1234595 RepID=UPI0004ADE95B|nr:hypothetical protein [Pacificimonas flava]MBB5279924.1 hypothetical protein [Pacificimonas flava]
MTRISPPGTLMRTAPAPALVRKRRRPLRDVFALPTVIALASLTGLGLALLGDGLFDAGAWILLGLPIMAAMWALRTRRR